jgi:hypothetical protein
LQKRYQFEPHYEVLCQKSSYIAGNFQQITIYIHNVFGKRFRFNH